jgi:hypothetical protein
VIPDAAERCPTCGGAVEVVTGDEGTSSYRPRLLTDEMVERAAEAIAGACGCVLSQSGEDVEEWRRLGRRALEAALGSGT